MTNDGTSLSWSVPCGQEFALSITIAEGTYRMKNEQLISLDSTGTVCTSLVKGWVDPVIRTYLFGAPFATSAYIVYNAMKDQSADKIGVAPRAGDTVIIINQGVPTNVIVSAIVASVCGVGFIIVATLFYLDRQRRRQDSDTPKTKTLTKKLTLREKGRFKIDPFPIGAPPNSATPILSSSMGQINYSLEQGPIGGEPSDEGVLKPERQGSLSSPLTTPQSPDNKMPPALMLMRQSQITESSVPSPEPSPLQDAPTVYHSFYGARVPSVVVAPGPGGQRYQSPEVPESPVAPPPYSQRRANRASIGLATPPSPLRDGH